MSAVIREGGSVGVAAGLRLAAVAALVLFGCVATLWAFFSL